MKKQHSEFPALNQIKIERSKKSFWQYCKNLYPAHYSDDRQFLHDLCNTMQEFVESEDKALIINAPPRHYKSFTATNLCQWCIGKWPNKKVMTGSYNATLSGTFSKGVKNAIQLQNVDGKGIVFSDIFPNIQIKRGDGANDRWALVGQHSTYLATSPTGTATGFGCDFLIIDDLIRSAAEANNALSLQKQWDWFTNTMLSRIEEGGKIIIVMTRWHSRDLSGRALDHFTQLGWSMRHVTLKAMQDDGTMLCDDVLSKESYLDKVRTMGLDIASANYQQEPIDIKGKLYTSLKMYDSVEGISFPDGIFAYCDTADEGSDFLCAVIYGVHNHEVYVLDVYYTKDSMEKTEIELARRLNEWGVSVAIMESNNGGRGFCRAVQRISNDDLKNYKTVIKWYTQNKNKNSRILTMASWVIEHIYFPSNWRHRWPEFYDSMTTYQREGKNEHDDAEDCITAIAERVSKTGSTGFLEVNT